MSQQISHRADGAFAAAPSVVATRLGPVECAVAGEGPAVLSVHGAMGGFDQGLLLARTLGPPGFRWVCVSRPGYLGTPLSAGRSPEEQADLHAALLDALGIRDAAVLAISGGGYSAIHFALRHRDRCRALVLVSTTGEKVDGGVPFAFRVLKVLARVPPVAAAMQRRAGRDPERSARRSIPDPALRARTLADPESRALLTALALSTTDRIALRLPGTENDIRVTRARDYPLERVAVPALVVHGTQDRMVPFARHGKVLAERIPGAELLAVEGGDHVSIFTHRALCRERVGAFLREHRAAASGAAAVTRAATP